MKRTHKTTLQELIKSQGYLQRQVAKKIGMKSYQFTRLLQNEDNIPIGTLRAIVQAIGLRLSISIDHEI